MSKQTFRRELMNVINKHSKENGSNTPDFILAEYLTDCLKAFDKATKYRDNWYGYQSSFVREPKLFECIDFSSAEEPIIDPEKVIHRDPEMIREDRSEPEMKFPDEKPGYPSRRNAELP